MLRGESFCPDSLIPFPTYRSVRSDGKGFRKGPPEIAETLAHFYFSERFRGLSETSRRSLFLLPSASEARKEAQRTAPSDSWMESRLAIVKMAVWQQYRTMPQLPAAILSGEVTIGSARSLGRGWEPRFHGDERWAQVVRKTAEKYLSSDKMVLLASGDTDIFNPFLFSSKLSLLLGRKRVHELLVGCRPGVDALAEQWAIQNYVPVVHLPVGSMRGTVLHEVAVDSLAATASHAFLISKGNDKTVLALLSRLTNYQTPTRVVRLDHDGRPLPKTATHATRRH